MAPLSLSRGNAWDARNRQSCSAPFAGESYLFWEKAFHEPQAQVQVREALQLESLLPSGWRSSQHMPLLHLPLSFNSHMWPKECAFAV